MASQNPIGQWFTPGEGIERQVISDRIQRFLGNDATVRPGKGTGEHAGVEGYWIKAYRNLTTAMVEDLRAESAKFRQERAVNSRGKRPHVPDLQQDWTPDAPPDPYGGGNTHTMNVGRTIQREGNQRDGNSPRAMEHPILPRNQPPQTRPPPGSVDIIMGEKPPLLPMGFPVQAGGGFGQGPRSMYPPDHRSFPVTDMQPQGPGYARPTVISPSPFGAPPPPDYTGTYQAGPHDPAYPPRGAYYGPGAGEVGPPMSHRVEPQYVMTYNGQPQPSARGPDRYGQPDFPDPRYAYPSPATTVSSLTARDREPLPGLPQQQPRYGQAAGMPSNYDRADNDSGYGPPAGAQYDHQYGRPTASPDYSPQQSSAPGPIRNGGSIRRPPSIIDGRDPQRRRL